MPCQTNQHDVARETMCCNSGAWEALSFSLHALLLLIYFPKVPSHLLWKDPVVGYIGSLTFSRSLPFFLSHTHNENFSCQTTADNTLESSSLSARSSHKQAPLPSFRSSAGCASFCSLCDYHLLSQTGYAFHRFQSSASSYRGQEYCALLLFDGPTATAERTDRIFNTH